MRLAIETRRAAWQCLRENDAYGKYLTGVALLALVILGFVLLTGMVVAPAMVALKPVFAKSTLVVDPAALSTNPMAWWWLIQDACHQPLEVIVAALSVGAVVGVALFYLVGFATWSSRAMAIASARKGVTAMHALSGWGHGWQMLGLRLWRDTMVVLGLLFFIAPGVRWHFSYALAPYLLVDHPDWSSWQCLRESERLMEGNRWRLFKLQISFAGWYLLIYAIHECVPFVGKFANYFLTPYPETAEALFYEELLDLSENPLGDSGLNPNQNPERIQSNDED